MVGHYWVSYTDNRPPKIVRMSLPELYRYEDGLVSIDARYLCHICYARVIVHGLSLGDDPSGNVLDKRQSVSSHKWNEVK